MQFTEQQAEQLRLQLRVDLFVQKYCNHPLNIIGSESKEHMKKIALNWNIPEHIAEQLAQASVSHPHHINNITKRQGITEDMSTVIVDNKEQENKNE